MNGLTQRSRAYHYGPTASAPHYVYRCYDADGDLIYIGVTSNVKRRIAAHRRASGQGVASRWLSACMARYEVEGPFADRGAGREVERSAIRAEQPLFNFQDRNAVGFAASMSRGQVARYLIERGHVDLAIETTCNCWSDEGVEQVCVAHEWTRSAGRSTRSKICAPGSTGWGTHEHP